MSLSESSNLVYQKTRIGKDSSRLIGEFAGCDLYLQPGSTFFDIENGGSTYVKCQEYAMYSSIIGRKSQVNSWLGKKRTPKSYIVQYLNSTVVCESDYFVSYKYNVVLPNYRNRIKRIFPFRRKIQKSDVTTILDEIAKHEYLVLKCRSTAQGANGDLFLELAPVPSLLTTGI